jgi:hypothetical protein
VRSGVRNAAAGLLLAAVAGLVWAQGAVSIDLVAFQGRLTASNGAPLTGAYAFVVRLYTVPTGGEAVFAETLAATAVDNGVYSLVVGAAPERGTLSEALSNDDVWMELEVAGETLAPRVRITSAPFAARARTADAAGDARTVGGYSAEALRDASNLNAGTVSTDRFSALEDLQAEGAIGSSAGQVAAGDHTHSGLGAIRQVFTPYTGCIENRRPTWGDLYPSAVAAGFELADCTFRSVCGQSSEWGWVFVRGATSAGCPGGGFNAGAYAPGPADTWTTSLPVSFGANYSYTLSPSPFCGASILCVR